MSKKYFILIVLAVTIKTFLMAQDTISIENVNVIPMTEEIVLNNQRVIIANHKIIKIESSNLPLRYSVNLTIDGSDKYLIPGLAEMHYHFRSNDVESDMKLLIANGITTVRNMAEFNGQDQIDIREKISSGKLLGPKYFTAGPYLTSNDFQSIESVDSIVKMHKERGYDFLKLADNLPLNVYLKLLEECSKNNIPVVGHAQRNLPLEYSLRMKSLEHIEEFLYLSDDLKDKQIYDFDESELNSLAIKIRQNGIYIGTTLVVFDFINNCLNDEKFSHFQKDDLVKYLAKEQRDAFLTEKNDYRKLKDREFNGLEAPVLFNNYFLWIKKFAKILSDNEAPLLIGSDTYGMVIVGFSLHKEFEFLQEAGIKPYKILLSATVNPARYLELYSSQGTIAEGKNADMILLSKNPLENIKNTRLIEGVVLNGKWINREEIDLMLKEVEEKFK